MVAGEPREDVDTLERPHDQTDQLSSSDLDRLQAEIEQIVQWHGRQRERSRTNHISGPCAVDQMKIARIARRIRRRVERLTRT